jgi:hypothetical protein
MKNLIARLHEFFTNYYKAFHEDGLDGLAFVR